MIDTVQSGTRLQRDRPRVVVVAHRVDDSGGMERVHAELVRRLIDHYHFTIVASNIADDLRGRVDWRRVPLPARPIPLRFVVFYGLAALQLRKVRADLIHVCGALVPNRADVASVHFCHAGFVAASGRLAPKGSTLPRRLNASLLRSLAIGAERWSYRPGRVKLLAPVSGQVAEELRAAYPGVAIEETPNGVDLDRFRLDYSARRAVREELGTDQNATAALFVGGDWDRKGLALVIRALAVARSSGGQLELWVLGAGDERRFGSFAVEADVGDSVRFLGHSPEPERYFKAADIFVCGSSYEPFSLALLEAAATGLPLVSTRVGVASALIEREGDPAGFLVEHEAGQMGAALAALAADAELRSRYGRAARQKAEPFGWESLADVVDKIYGRVLAGSALL
jgi:UDP-glucose:(heptosyl)LPS alpha-1,3-glucosyltransferase